MSTQVDHLRWMNLPLSELIEFVINQHEYHTNEVFDYLWRMNMSEVEIYSLVSKCFFFQSEYVMKKLLTIKFSPSLIAVFIKQTKIGLTPLMLELLVKNYPSVSDMVYLLYDSPQFLTSETFDLFKRKIRTRHEAMTILDNAKGLSVEQREGLVELCLELANEQEKL